MTRCERHCTDTCAEKLKLWQTCCAEFATSHSSVSKVPEKQLSALNAECQMLKGKRLDGATGPRMRMSAPAQTCHDLVEGTLNKCILISLCRTIEWKGSIPDEAAKLLS